MMDLKDLIQAIAALGAMIAALSSYFALRGMRRSNESAIYVALAQRYDSPAMRRAFNTLLKWHEAHGEGFADAWARSREANDPEAERVNSARRVVSRYFLNIVRLREANAINRHFARLLASVYGLNVFYKIVVPLNRRLASDVRHFDDLTARLRRIKRTYAGGEILKSF